jgi:hypothetical protein
LRKNLLIIIILILLSACSSEPNNKMNDSLHSDLSSQDAAAKGYIVAGPSGFANVFKLENFYEDYLNKTRNCITLARYTDEGDPIYVDLEFDGEEILYTYDNTWDGFGGQNKGVRKTSCTQMGIRTGPRADRNGTEYFMTSCRDDIGYSDLDKKEYFLLFIDDNINN